jgi:hypothetical protein
MNEFIEQNYILEGENPRKIKDIGREGLYQLFAKLGYKVGCEVGVEKGKNAAVMFDTIPDLKLFGVDPYSQHPQCSYEYHAKIRGWDDEYLDHCKRQALKRMGGKNFELVQGFSEDTVNKFENNSLDFVYIDGDHSYDFVMLDVILWGRKVRKGGILSGHDYYKDRNRPGRRAKVTQAIDDYTRLHGIKFFITDDDHKILQGDGYPSWFWFKLEDVYPNTIGA